MKNLKYIWPPAIIATIIFYLCCLISPKDVPESDLPNMDKLVHFLMYFGLSGVAMFNYIFRNKGYVIILKLIIFTVIVPILYGGLIELYQAYLTDNRSGDWLDLLADALGSLTVFPLGLYYRKILLRR